ncbi:hypothetical protein ARALYDRAFT_915814 [Arabidopsis lyrata subsp. lyrata]|uniref:Uncharacterized protein n=1 Tax=Arabidopsis lyrata subsp. lyrata TaxID=81972 RepID=D7MI68_ARALL|nr:hypothetical protein ARALYDRAFT_915814 [Arabidopsis lyrata subsp. lyrata]
MLENLCGKIRKDCAGVMGKRKILRKENDYGDISRFVEVASIWVHVFITELAPLPRPEHTSTIKVQITS